MTWKGFPGQPPLYEFCVRKTRQLIIQVRSSTGPANVTQQVGHRHENAIAIHRSILRKLPRKIGQIRSATSLLGTPRVCSSCIDMACPDIFVPFLIGLPSFTKVSKSTGTHRDGVGSRTLMTLIVRLRLQHRKLNA